MSLPVTCSSTLANYLQQTYEEFKQNYYLKDGTCLVHNSEKKQKFVTHWKNTSFRKMNMTP
jgi:hypothetical protein